MARVLTDELSEPWRVLLWRQEELERAGYPVHIAMVLAEEPGVDLHKAIDLLGRGASAEEALRILL